MHIVKVSNKLIYLYADNGISLKIEGESSDIINRVLWNLTFVLGVKSQSVLNLKTLRRKQDFCIKVFSVRKNVSCLLGGNKCFLYSEIVQSNSSMYVSVKSSGGSYASIDYFKRRGVIAIDRDDSIKNGILTASLWSALLFTKIFSIHAVWIRAKRKSYIFVGNSGEGKSTIGGILCKIFNNIDLLADDLLFIYAIKNKVFGFSYQKSFDIPIDYVFFIERTKDKSGLLRISKREALERIVFHSDMCFKKDDAATEYRLETLVKLVKQSLNFVFYNGDGLYKKADAIKKIFLNVFR